MAEQARRSPREDLTPVIVRQAATLFAERGFEATTMQDIAARVGITAPGLYYYFPSKQSLLFEVLETGLESVVTAVEEAVGAARGDRVSRPTEELRAFTRRHVIFQIEEQEEATVYGAAFYGSHHMLNALTAQQRGRLSDLQHKNLDLLRGILRNGVKAGEFTIGEPTPTAFAIIGIGEYVPTWFKPGGRLSPEEVGELCAALVLRMVGVAPAAAKRHRGRRNGRATQRRSR